MGTPYSTRIKFFIEGTEDLLFHELEGLQDIPKVDNVIFFNDVEYKVESVKLYLYDTDFTNPQTSEEVWSITQVLYKVYVSAI